MKLFLQTSCQILVLSICCLCLETTVHANSANVEVRVEGVGVFPDTINGLNAMAMNRSPIKFIFSAESDFVAACASNGFRLYSPDGSISSVSHKEKKDAFPTEVEFYPAWDNSVWTLTGTNFILKDCDGLLPDSMYTGGVHFGPGGFGPTELVDIFALTMSFPDDTAGVFCIDSTFVPCCTPWLFCNDVNIAPSWGSSVGGYPDGGFCITIYERCCEVPGDASHSSLVTIHDAVFLERYIFQDGATPQCLTEADADGGGDINIGDAVFLIRYIFQDGAAPSCAP
ncbi:MAG: hypothetical protein IIB00_06740 [candidate division Zixibacteria bacterium]|nr:hypothetical protein [candidate division Zixibacteria bacterium]